MQADPSPVPVFDALVAERGNPLGGPVESMPVPSFDLGPNWPPRDYDPPTIQLPALPPLPAPESVSALAQLDNGAPPTPQEAPR